MSPSCVLRKRVRKYSKTTVLGFKLLNRSHYTNLSEYNTNNK